MTPTRQFAVAALLALLACADRPSPPIAAVVPDSVAVQAAIQGQVRALEAAATAGDVEAVVRLYTADAYLREPGIAVRGADSLRALLTAAFKTIAVLEFKTVPEHYVYSGDRVVEFAAYRERTRDRASGAEALCDCRYAAEWVRGADGQWRLGYLLASPRELAAAPAENKPPK